MPSEAEQIVRDWLDDVSFSAATWNLDAHMLLVSRQVEVAGIPGISNIDYEGWKLRRKTEFDKKLLHSLTYRMGDILKQEQDRILFTVEETMKSHTGQTIVVDKKVTLHREEDGMWRVRHEQFERIRER